LVGLVRRWSLDNPALCAALVVLRAVVGPERSRYGFQQFEK
jgi:hypothetical protein